MKDESRYSASWTLYVGAAPSELQQQKQLEPWVQELAELPRRTLGELEDCPLLENVLPDGWSCSVIPEYILAHTFVAAALSPNERYAMLFFSAVGEELHVQQREPQPGLIGRFHVRLIRPVLDRASLAENLRHAFALLQARGFLAAT
jgi:hypothetical protein